MFKYEYLFISIPIILYFTTARDDYCYATQMIQSDFVPATAVPERPYPDFPSSFQVSVSPPHHIPARAAGSSGAQRGSRTPSTIWKHHLQEYVLRHGGFKVKGR